MSLWRLAFRGKARVLAWYAFLVIGLPLATLLALGIVYLWQQKLLLIISVVWLALTLVGVALFRFWPEKSTTWVNEPATQKNSSTILNNSVSDGSTDKVPDSLQEQAVKDLPADLNGRSDWTAIDHEVWKKARQMISDVVELDPHWQDLPVICIEILEQVADEYALDNQGSTDRTISSTAARTLNKLTSPQLAFKFTLPEALLVLSIVSERYRHLIVSHVPFADRINLSSLLSIYERRNKLETGYRWAHIARRTARLTNPLAAAVSELREQFTGRLFNQLNQQLQSELKKLLLQEVAQVGMDLYSGRLKTSAVEIQEHQSDHYKTDLLHLAPQTEPLRIAVLGQVSCGKSSLINALSDSMLAETDILPTTNKTTVHALTLDNHPRQGSVSYPELHFIETVGMTAEEDSISLTAEAALNADMIFMVVRATQPARAPDKQLITRLFQSYDQNKQKRAAPLVLILTHIDQLSPKAEWTPPYDLRGSDQKSTNIRQALESCSQQLGLSESTPSIPICASDTRSHYNVDLLAAQINLLVADATQTQLNRKRLEIDANRGGIGERWSQARQLGRVLGKAIMGSD